MRSRLLWFGLIGVACASACQIIAGIGDRSVWDGGVTTSDAGGDGALDPCSMVAVPPAPDESTSSPSDAVTFTAALSKIMLGTTDAGPFYGFNLDRTCTCPAKDSCQRPPSSSPACDDEGGIDNYARRIFEQLNQFAPDGGFITEGTFNNALTQGFSGALIQVANYNGEANDADVTVTVYASQGFEGYPATHPAFDGGDSWIIDPSSASGQFSTTNAYVANFVLVATLDGFPIEVGSTYTQAVTIQLNSGTILATLQMNGHELKSMTGMLGGRWDPSKFLPSLQDVPDPVADGSFLCGSDLTYQVIKTIICENVDVNLSPSNDGTGVCNAVSMGLGFEAVPALLGPTGPTLTPKTPCDAGWKDQCP